jgi:hypothetical protein
LLSRPPAWSSCRSWGSPNGGSASGLNPEP